MGEQKVGTIPWHMKLGTLTRKAAVSLKIYSRMDGCIHSKNRTLGLSGLVF
jgi:hypothetical protein